MSPLPIEYQLMSRRAAALDDLAAHGGKLRVRCQDGFTMSVIAHAGAYCTPRPDWDSTPPGFDGPFTQLEVGFPSQRPEPWDQWAAHADDGDREDPTDTVYGYVPVQMVRDLIEMHGGEV